MPLDNCPDILFDCYKFEPGLPEQSYLLLGNGQELTIPSISNLYDLNQYDLVVLSACETALGGPGKDGLEIAGLAHYFLTDDRADTVIASLWKVNDASTSELMQRFYINIADSENPMTRSEALRRAQLSFLSDSQTSDSERSRATVRPVDAQSGVPVDNSSDLSHPYYWAPFILIGNGL